MAMDTDVGLWKQPANWLWALLIPFVGILWKKADNAVPKEEMRDHIKDDKDTHEEFRETMRNLYSNAEKDRALAAQHHVELVTLIHEKSAEVRSQINGGRK